MLRREHEALLYVIDGAVEVLSFWGVSVMIVFAIHNIEIIYKTVSHMCNLMLTRWISINRRPVFPIILWLLIKEWEFLLTIRRRLKNILKLVCVLMIVTTFIEKLLELGVIKMVIFTVCYMCSIIPRRTILRLSLSLLFTSPSAWTLTISRLLRKWQKIGRIPLLSYNLIKCLEFHSLWSYLIIIINLLLLILLFHLKKQFLYNKL